jgi:ABC-type antimicrobial peptide transport system permease subunit
MILGRGLMLAAGGLAIGIVASVALSRFIRGLLFGVQPLDAMTFIGVSAVLLLVSLLASSAPAYRAANLDPMRTLRDQ